MIEKLRAALIKSSLSQEEVEHILCLLFLCGDSNRQNFFMHLINAGYISVQDNRCTLTEKGRIYRDTLVQKLAQFHAASEMLFRKYFDNELSHIKKELQSLKNEWRKVRDTRIQYKQTLMKQGKDKAAIKKDTHYRQLQKEQNSLRTRMRHAEKEYNKKLSACIKHIGIIDL